MSNIINFPGIENEQKKIQEQAKAAVNIIMSAMMESKNFDLLPFSSVDIEILSDFGEGMTFDPLVASRLISSLATEIKKLRIEILKDDNGKI
mgnify:FL=1|tara:strand:- start:365 stop:640 length:276 start_codon:yes stop_codon:yes gene_type:complete